MFRFTIRDVLWLMVVAFRLSIGVSRFQGRCYNPI
jgi:hypothetical protein